MMATCSCPMPIPVRTANGEPLVWRCANCNRPLPVPDPRDAEIERLKAEVERLREYERLHGVRSNEIGRLRANVGQVTMERDDLMARANVAENEIARLKAALADARAEFGRAMLTGREIEHENNRLRAALAAGPAALRKLPTTAVISPRVWMGVEDAAEIVEAAQRAVMEEKP